MTEETNTQSHDISSFRSISDLSFLSKLIQHVASSHFVNHGKTNHLLPDNQSAYQHFHSMETALLIVHNKTVRANNNVQLTALVLLDLSSTLNTVDHDCLLSVLYRRFAQLVLILPIKADADLHYSRWLHRPRCCYLWCPARLSDGSCQIRQTALPQYYTGSRSCQSTKAIMLHCRTSVLVLIHVVCS